MYDSTEKKKKHLESQLKPNNFGRQMYQSFVLDTFQMAWFLSSFAPLEYSASKHAFQNYSDLINSILISRNNNVTEEDNSFL